MNVQKTIPLVLTAIQRTKEDIIDHMKLLKRSIGQTDRIRSLDDLFTIGCAQADYVVEPADVPYFNIDDSMTGYESLQTAEFHVKDGMDVEPYSTIAIYDESSYRRLYVIVLEVGRNIILHDYHARGDSPTTVLAATGGVEKTLLGMTPYWTDSPFGIIKASTFFGFEFDMATHSVYFPDRPMKNWIKEHKRYLNFK